MKGDHPLLALVLAYAAASLFHHGHNATYLNDYPNMPAWLTPAGVCVAWLATTAVGVAGYLLLRSGYRVAGLGTIALYGALGLYGLAHYGVAPVSAHSPTMHLTIWLEATTGTLVLIGVAWLIVGELRQRAVRA
jgi:uncharacterized membrane protein YphA (DoxX/SURF4 family)